MDVVGYLVGFFTGGFGVLAFLGVLLLVFFWLTKQGPFKKFDIDIVVKLRRSDGLYQKIQDRGRAVIVNGVTKYELKKMKIKLPAANFKVVGMNERGQPFVEYYMPNRGVAWPVYDSTVRAGNVCSVCGNARQGHDELIDKELEELTALNAKVNEQREARAEIDEKMAQVHLSAVTTGIKAVADALGVKSQEEARFEKLAVLHKAHKTAQFVGYGVGIMETNIDPENLGWEGQITQEVTNFWKSGLLQYAPYVVTAFVLFVFLAMGWQIAESNKYSADKLSASVERASERDRQTADINRQSALVLRTLSPLIEAYLAANNISAAPPVTTTTAPPP